MTLTLTLTFQPRCEASCERISFALLAKVKICGAEVWSSEVEVKLIEGHRGEVHSLTCGDGSPFALAIFRDVTLGTSQKQPPWGVKRVDPVCRVTTQLQHSFLKRCTRRLKLRVEGCISKIPLLAFSTTPCR